MSSPRTTPNRRGDDNRGKYTNYLKTKLPQLCFFQCKFGIPSNTWKLSTAKKLPFQHLETFHNKKTTFPTLGNLPQQKNNLSNAWKLSTAEKEPFQRLEENKG